MHDARTCRQISNRLHQDVDELPHIEGSELQALDVGSGSGYLTTAMAYLVQPNGRAVGVEHIPQLVERSQEAAQRVPFAAGLLRDGVLSFHTVSRDFTRSFP